MIEVGKMTEKEVIEKIKELQFERGKKDAQKGALPRQATIYYLKGYLEGMDL